MSEFDRRRFLQAGGGAALTAGPLAGLLLAPAHAQQADTLTIAYNVGLPSWDPTTGPSAVNPSIQGIWKSVFDQYIDQAADLSFKPGLLSKWGWNADKTKIEIELRAGALWHDGTPVTAADVVWNLKRAGDPKAGNPVAGIIWSSVDNFQIQGNRITADVKQYVADYFKWMAFLTGFMIPQAYYEKLGAAGFEKKPVGSGPYMIDEFVQGSYVKLKAFDKYWGPKPAFKNVTIKFVTDPSARVAEIESGKSDVTLGIPFEEFDRLKALPALTGVSLPITDIAMIFITNVEPMLDENVRKAAVHAVDKQAIVKRLLRGYGVVIDTLQVPQYAAYDASIKVKYDPELAKSLLAKSGYSVDKPVKFKIQTTRGYLPKDYETVQAIVGMWRKVGIEAEIEVYEIAKHFELRLGHKLAPMAFYNWGDAIGDPNESTGFAMFGPSPHSGWKSKEVDAMIGPLWTEKDEAKRIAGWRKVDRYIADNALVLPVYQQVQTIVFKKSIALTPHLAGYLLAQSVTKAGKA
ncbi:ABC transporter substrate-binding protein [Variovorax sp. RB2P76]|uniref:ABC transporter substrate-binding protein n=1 Tax=Variovorax sp. RB2P76 TaxID=3443736 RepID=UPI003F46A41A